MASDDGGPAFPVTQNPTMEQCSPGMSLRDYFAGQVIGQVAAEGGKMRGTEKLTIQQFGTQMAELAYGIADAMLKERTK